jgi:hypothetical protein
MKINKYILILFASTVTLGSCKKSFLDEKPPTSVPVEVAIKTESDLNDAVNGMYAAMRNYFLFGRDIPVLGDQLGDNAYISSTNSGRYLTEQNYTYTSTNAEASDIWSQGYYSILQANRIIYAANTQFPTATNNVNQIKGEAYIARALTYLELVNFFATPYTVSSTASGVPLVTTPTNITGAFVKPARATVGAVYDKIISDLDSAYAIMPTTTTIHAVNSNYLSKYAAKAIQSRAYLYKGDYAKARDAALIVVSNGGYTLTPSTSYVAYWATPTATTNKVETIFELALNTATNNGFNGLDDFYSPNGYGDLLSYTALYDSYSNTDIRKSLIIPGTRGGATALVVNKYPNFTLATEKDDIKIIRYSEVLLTLAESYAALGDNVNALIYVNQVAKMRDPSFITYTSIGTQLKSDIVNERRKELAFEGLRYFDLQRLNLPVNRPTQANTSPTLTTLAAGDNRRILPIPQAEVDANASVVQNPGY